MISEFKDAIPGFPGYFIDPYGNVSGPKKSPLSGYIDSDGYRRVGLYNKGKYTNRGVHYLVCLTYFGPPPEGCVPRHLDGSKLNNCASNLAWGTQVENYADRRLHGTDTSGDKNGRAKISWDQARKVILLLDTGMRQVDVASVFGVTQPTISKIKLRHTWRG